MDKVEVDRDLCHFHSEFKSPLMNEHVINVLFLLYFFVLILKWNFGVIMSLSFPQESE